MFYDKIYLLRADEKSFYGSLSLVSVKNATEKIITGSRHNQSFEVPHLSHKYTKMQMYLSINVRSIY